MSRNNALPDPAILIGLGEAFAAGYFELPEAPPLQRWALPRAAIRSTSVV